MSVSILLRLIPGSRAEGRLAGQAQVVDTGEVATFRDADEMVALLQRASLAAPPRALSVTSPDSGADSPSAAPSQGTSADW